MSDQRSNSGDDNSRFDPLPNAMGGTDAGDVGEDGAQDGGAKTDREEADYTVDGSLECACGACGFVEALLEGRYLASTIARAGWVAVYERSSGVPAASVAGPAPSCLLRICTRLHAESDL